jgi:hypothetical protein
MHYRSDLFRVITELMFIVDLKGRGLIINER